MKNLSEMKRVFDVFHEGVYIVDRDRKILYFNPIACEISGFKKEDIEGTHCFDNTLNHIDENGKYLCKDGCPLMESIKTGAITDHFVYLHHKLGYRIRVHVRSTPVFEDGVIVGAVEVFIDETQKNTLLDELMFHKHLSLIDPLTGLFNRRFIDERFPMQLLDDRDNLHLGVLFIDIDDFKKINDIYGHLVGDDVLRTISRTIQYNLKTNDYVVRYGGEEIIVFLKQVDEHILYEIAEKLRLLIETTQVRTRKSNIKQTVSIGATIMKEGETLQDAIDRADQAMYMAKQNGKNQTVKK